MHTFTDRKLLNLELEDGRRSGMHFERRENPRKSPERAESEGDEGKFDNYEGLSCCVMFSLRSSKQANANVSVQNNTTS